MEKVILDIAGMRCGACSAGIELMLSKKKGIKSAKVSLNERMAVVEYDPAIVGSIRYSKDCERSRIYSNGKKVNQIGLFEIIGTGSYFFLLPYFKVKNYLQTSAAYINPTNTAQLMFRLCNQNLFIISHMNICTYVKWRFDYSKKVFLQRIER